MRLFPMPYDGTDDDEDGDKPLTEAAIRRIIQREGGGNANNAIAELVRENAKARRRARKVEAQLKTLTDSGRIAPEGAVILTADDGKRWGTIKKHLDEKKQTPEQLIEAAAKVGELESKVAESERKSAHAAIAKELGWKPDALSEVLDLKKLEVTMKDVTETVDGKKVKTPVPHVRKAGDEKGEWEPLETYAEENLKTFLPALTAKDDEGEEEEADRQTSTRRTTTGTQVPSQSRSKPAKGGKEEKTDDEIRRENLRENPALSGF
jgi:hypothetical protein